MSDPVDLAALRAMHEKATPGPWMQIRGNEENLADDECKGVKTLAESEMFEARPHILERFGLERHDRPVWEARDIFWTTLEGRIKTCDALLIVALVNAFPALADELEKARAIASAARQYVEMRDDPEMAQVVGTAWRHLCDMLEKQ